jgi:hypothetical protein
MAATQQSTGSRSLIGTLLKWIGSGPAGANTNVPGANIGDSGTTMPTVYNPWSSPGGGGSSGAGGQTQAQINQENANNAPAPAPYAGSFNFNQVQQTAGALNPGSNQEQQELEMQMEQNAGLSATGAQLLQNYNNGTLPPGMMQYIMDTQQEQMAEVKSQYAAMGLSNSSDLAGALNEVTNNTIANIATQLQTEYTNAMDAFGLTQNLMNYFGTLHVASMEQGAASSANTTALIGDAMDAIAMYFAL